ncbi:MAG: response regulator with CheY-like receiver domain and winged-helix DNA-binding domain [Verrucomicrobiales bacterium]|nr:response regulator with CheY-like receiver domain and winged-helix DNA-binding domain [Verrucomicrobiales bacterium]
MASHAVIQWSEFQQEAILLVEDNEDDVVIMQAAFRKAKIPNRLEIARDGEEALNYLSGMGKWADRNTYPLPVVILLDLNMPKKGGLEVLDWVRQQTTLRHVTVQVLTASSREEDVCRAFQLGANDYLVKPSRIETLVEMLKAWQSFTQFKVFPATPLASKI